MCVCVRALRFYKLIIMRNSRDPRAPRLAHKVSTLSAHFCARGRLGTQSLFDEAFDYVCSATEMIDGFWVT